MPFKIGTGRDKKRSVYKLELWRRNGFGADKTFYFMTNPQNCTIVDKDRIGYVRTFGGSWSENFGPDDKPITLSGNFGLSRVKDGWDATRGVVGATSALKYLRDNFIRLAELAIKEGASTNTFYLKFYDYSAVESNNKGWVVKVDSFEIARDKGAPFNYTWRLQMTAYGKALLKKNLKEFILGGAVVGGEVGTVLKTIGDFTGIGGADTSIGIWDTATGFFKALRKFNHAVNSISSSARSCINAVGGLRDFLIDSSVELLDSATNLVDALYDIVYDLEQLVVDFKNIHEDAIEIANYAVARVSTIERKWKNIKERLIAGNIIRHFNIDSALKAVLQLKTAETAARMIMLIQKPTALSGTDVIAKTDTETGVVSFLRVLYEGIKNVPLNMSLAEIADKYLGDALTIEQIVNANSSIDWDNRTADMPVLIPREISLSELMAIGNLVFDTDIGGTDIRFDDKGYIMVSATGNVALAEGIENIRAAVNRRIEISLGALSADDNYGLGLDNVLGEVNYSDVQTVIEERVSEAVQMDPRIKTVTVVKVIPSTNSPSDTHIVQIKIVTQNDTKLAMDFAINRQDFNNIF